MMRRIKIVFAGVILMSGVLNAATEDTARTRYYVGFQLGNMVSSKTFMEFPSFHFTPLVEYAINRNSFIGFSPGFGVVENMYPNLLLQCDIRYMPFKVSTTYYFAGVAFIKPFCDDIYPVGKYIHYKTHKWHENFHITAGLGFRWTSFSLDLSMMWPIYPLFYEWSSYYKSLDRYRYLYLSIGFRFMIKGREK